jgi:hypothetical protein
MLVIRTNFAGTVFLEIQFSDFQKTVPAKLVRITSMTLFFPRKNLIHTFDTSWSFSRLRHNFFKIQ